MKSRILFILRLPPPVHGAAMVGKYIHDSKLINETFDFLAERYNVRRLQSNIDQEMPDHWHCVFELTSLDTNLQKFITSLKSMSSRKLKAVIPAWQGYSASYYLGTLSQNGNELDNALAYVKSQHGNGC